MTGLTAAPFSTRSPTATSAAVVDAPGFVDQERIEAAIARALCLVLPSSREGYGLIVVEAAAKGVPSIVVAGADNAATELIEDGINGFVVPTASPEDIAGAIVRVQGAGPALRDSTARWFAEHAAELSITSSVEVVARLCSRTARRSSTS